MTPNSNSPRRALFAGSFDPFTIGHASILERALAIFDSVVVAVGVHAAKNSSASPSQRLDNIKRLYPSPRAEVVAYDHELTVDLARRLNCSHLVRGVRSVADFEYERNIADINRQISGIDTVLLLALPEHAAISSSIVRELQSYNHDISSLIP